MDDTAELAAFRSKWKEELGIGSRVENVQHGDETEQGEEEEVSHSSAPDEELEAGDDTQQVEVDQASAHEEATRLYWMGVAAEESGDMTGAIMYYRQAVQLHPDVEWEASRMTQPPTEFEEVLLRGEECESDLLGQLTDEFHELSLKTFCQPKKPAKGTHISALPAEVLRYVLRWVASAQLDMRAIEQVAKVCKGFYLLAREPQLWRTACKRVWGECHPGTYGSWRRMYILRPHLHYNGVYISKTSYVRQGEHSVDGFYKAYHTVTYYRFLRFFPDGCVMYQTSPEEPSHVVGKLCHKHSSEAVMLGTYHLQDRNLVIELVCEEYQGGVRGGRGRGRSKRVQPTHNRTFHLELLLNKRKSKQLTWIEHYCSTIHLASGEKQVTQFPINYMYTPFHFSRVKSYTLNSVGLLQ